MSTKCTRLKNICSSVAASGLWLILFLFLLANLSIPASAEADTDEKPEQIPAADFQIHAVEVDIDAAPLPNQSPVTTLSEGDLHGYILTATGTASSGYCRIVAAGHSDNYPQYYYVSPIAQGSTVRLVLQVASGTTLSFDGFEGEAPEDIMLDRLAVPTPAQDGDTVLVAELSISETPSIEYSVPEGATLAVIAGHFGVSPQDILIYNGVDTIAPGDTIRIPNPAVTTPYEQPRIYVVEEGDTLRGIADAHGVPMKALCKWNDLTLESTIYPGLELEIPVLYENIQEDPQPEESVSEPTALEISGSEPTALEITVPESTALEIPDSEAITPEDSEYVEVQETENTDGLVCGVPRYFQNDYPHDRYASGTIATSGCSVTSLTMVANAITGYDYTVDELAEYFGGCAENNMQRLEIGSEILGLQFYKSKNWDYTLDALKEGAIVIALMEENSLFTDSQHFIVLAGLSEDGERIMVNDPNAANYDLWNLKNGFENGFKPEDILLGYSGAWVYQRTLEELPERYSEVRLSKLFKAQESEDLDPEGEAMLAASNYPEIRLTMEERDLLAKVIWAEARGECAAGQQAVAEVVLNRILSPQFGDTLNDVIYSEGQFRSVDKLEKAEPTQAQYQAIERAFLGTPVLNRNVLYFATYRTNDNVYMMIGNHIFCY